jgi:hypothetical protein
MATVTAYTAERMKQIEDSSIVTCSVVGNNLIVTRFNNTQINAGNVRGPQGIQGPMGVTSISICTSTTRPTGASLFTGLAIYETDTKRFYIYDGATWVYRGGTWICTSVTRPASPFAGLMIFETDTKLLYVYDGTAWLSVTFPSRRLAYMQWTAPQGPTTGNTEAALQGLTTPSIVIPSATRLVNVKGYIRNFSGSGGDAVIIKIREGNGIAGTMIQDAINTFETAGAQVNTCGTLIIERTYAPGAGSKQWTLTMQGATSPVIGNAAATSPQWIEVTDMGG